MTVSYQFIALVVGRTIVEFINIDKNLKNTIEE